MKIYSGNIGKNRINVKKYFGLKNKTGIIKFVSGQRMNTRRFFTDVHVFVSNLTSIFFSYLKLSWKL